MNGDLFKSFEFSNDNIETIVWRLLQIYEITYIIWLYEK